MTEIECIMNVTCAHYVYGLIIIGYSNICTSLLDVQSSWMGCNLNKMFRKKRSNIFTEAMNLLAISAEVQEGGGVQT